MPRRGRGGARQGKPGATYSNRSDLHVPKANFTGQAYGTASAQSASQAAVPVAAPPNTPTPQTTPAAATPGPDPGTLGSLLDPTARPNEPLTAGLPTGPGPGPQGLRQATGDPDLDQLRAIYRGNPSPALRELIEFIQQGR